MKHNLILLMATGLLMVSITGFSQSKLKIGHVDIAELLAAIPGRDSAAAIINKETNEMQSTYNDMTAEYNKKMDDYEKMQATYSPLVKKNKETELFDMEKRIKDFEQNAQTNIQKRNEQLIQPLLNRILRAIDKVAADSGYTYILDVSKGSVVYTSKDSKNLNPLVLKIIKP